MGINKILKITFAILIIGTFLNIGFMFKKSQYRIVQLEKQNLRLKQQEQIYKNSVELCFNRNSVDLSECMDYRYAFYFPSSACSKCLEDLLLLIDDDMDLKENLLIYFDDIERAGIVSQFNDMYGTNYKYIAGTPLFHKEQSKISLLKLNKGLITGVLLLDAESKQDFKSLLSIFNTLR